MKRLFFTSEKTDNRIFQYILGFQPSDGWLLLDDETHGGLVFLDGRYIEKEITVGEWKIEKVPVTKKIMKHLDNHIQQDEIVMLEKTLPYDVLQKLQTPDQEHNFLFHVEKDAWQEHKRAIKSTNQIASIKKAITITEQLWELLVDLGEDLIGMTELEVRGMLIQQAFLLGAEAEAFDAIVATGPNSAVPHHTSGKTSIQAGVVLVDMGRKVNGWCSDFTRTMRIGEGTEQKEEFEKVLEIVRGAHDLAIQMIEPGTAFLEIAKAARKHIDDAGYGEYYVHSLGHGVGLDVHEAPRVSIKSEDIVQSGMVYTIEPGIYLPGNFGVRWENIVIVG